MRTAPRSRSQSRTATPGHRELGFGDAWRKARGANEPKLVIGDDALGTWAAPRDVFPHARRQVCWVRAVANVLDCLPKRLRPRANAGSKEAALAMAHKLLDAAHERWRRFNGHELVADVLAGAARCS